MEETDSALYRAWNEYRRQIEGGSLLLTNGMFRVAAQGNINLYRVFGYAAAILLSDSGRAGMVVQSGFLTDGQGSDLLLKLMSEGRLLVAMDFENRGNFFPNVHAQFRFALIVLGGEPQAKR